MRDRATVMGLGLFGGGAGAARYLCEQGYRVTVTDLRSAAELAPAVEALADLDLDLRLGEHRQEDFENAELVVVNPAVRPGNPFVQTALGSGAALATEISLFTRACRGRVVGITGTAGKSTTTALLGAMLERAGRRVHVGGNIGRSLLGDLPDIGPGDLVVLELSSFHLHWLRRDAWRPEVGVFTNFAPNHLDWHGTIEAYFTDKAGIVPGRGGTLVACHDDPRVRELAASAACRLVWTARDAEPDGDAVFWRDDALVTRTGGQETEIARRSEVRLIGGHSLWNVAAAAAAALAVDAPIDSLREEIGVFSGLRHRLEPVASVDGMLCVNDSKATTPEASALALAAFDQPVLLLAGGYDKGLDPAPLVKAARARARAVFCFGQTGPALARALEDAGVATVRLTETMGEALVEAFSLAAPGTVLLLSPGHASWGQFVNYEQRGDDFARAVRSRAESTLHGSADAEAVSLH